MTEKKWIQPTLVEKIYCFIGGKRHKAFVEHRIGADVFWCKKHGIIASSTNALCTTEQMIKRQISDKKITTRIYKMFEKAEKKWKKEGGD